MKLPLPVNKNNRLAPEHVCYMGTTGSCKTTAIRQLKLIPKAAQVVLFDPYRDHAGQMLHGMKVKPFTTFAEFYQYVWFARKGREPFRCALVGQERTRENLELFAQMVWSMGDGKHPRRLHCVIEELAKFTTNIGKLDGAAGELWTGGRGFGLVMHATFQRSQEIPKTVLDESKHIYIGAVSSTRNAKYIAEYFDVPYEDILALKSCNERQHLGAREKYADYILKSPGIGNHQQGKIYPGR
ncbi:MULTISPECIES: hypothetical protein [Vibrio]|uniref:hypothetical protein n=1 Tax=Vibrio TaxID=662 RepID=UPI00257E6BA9|nr:hypothetical protein [Vibrio sp.]